MSAYDDLAERLRALCHEVAVVASPPVERWEVVTVEPLAIRQVGGEDDLVLEEGDPDVEIDRGVLTDRPELGDLVRVHRDGADWIVAGVIRSDDG